MANPIRLNVNGRERKRFVITAPADPTAASFEVAVTAPDTAPSSWTAGSWSGSWNSTTGEVDALSPIMGAAGGDITVAAGTWHLHARWTVPVGENPAAQFLMIAHQ